MKVFFNSLVSEWMVSDRSGERPLREFTRQKRIEAGIAVNTLETQAGIAHPSYKQFEEGVTRSSLAGLRALEFLGYDLFVFGCVSDKHLEARGTAHATNT